MTTSRQAAKESLKQATSRQAARESLNQAPPESTKRPIMISAVVDVVGALANRSMRGNMYLLDTNKAGGSTGIGTEELRTRVQEGDQLLWTVLPLECEAYVSIDAVVIDREVCEPERKVYPGTDIAFWTGTVKKGNIGEVPYKISFKLGTMANPLSTVSPPVLVG